MDAAALRADLQASRAKLFAPLAGLSEEQFRFRPNGEDWSIAVHLAHLLRIERVYAERATLALREHEPHVASTRVHNDDDPALAQHLAVPQIIHGLQAARRALEAVLDSGDDALERAALHETLGRMTVRAMIEKMAGHEAEHTALIERLARLAPPPPPEVIPLTQAIRP